MFKQLKRKILPIMMAPIAKFCIRLILRSCKVKVIGLSHLTSTAEQFPCIIALWHNHLAIVSEILYKNAPQFRYTAFISKSRDGEPLARLANSYPMGRAIRVPHNARHFALSQMIECLNKPREVLLITPDGPRGPRHVVKPGILLAAEKTQSKIIPFSWHANRYWQLNSWDKMMLPKPFSTIKIVFGKPI